jgi:hypothetical protein
VRSSALFVPSLVLTILTAGAVAQAQGGAEPAASAPRLSLSLERVASVNAVFFSVDDGDDEYKLRSKGITAGGPLANPLGAPRLALDFLSQSGFTFGVGLAFASGDLDSQDRHREIDEGGYSLFMLTPRVGYRIAVTDWLDLTPRAGMTIGWARISAAETESCDYSYDPETGQETEDCSKGDADAVSLFAAVANLELVAAFRLTDSFNILTGLSYDLLVAANAKEEEAGYGSEDSDKETFDNGHLSSLQLWFGLGGYL